MAVTVSKYATITGKIGYAVDGPRGHYLITENKRGSWEVWRSDSLSTAGIHADLADAIADAQRKARGATVEELQAIAEFDHPFTVNDDGTLTDATGVYAPDVWNSDTDDIDIESDDWRALTGYTGQYSYNGAVMHASEYLGGALARDILETPGTYVVVSVEVLPTDDDPEPFPAGWAVLRYEGEK